MNARFFLEQIREQKEIEFDDVRVDSEQKDVVEIVFANRDGDRVRVVLPKAKLKEMISWKMLWSL